MKQDDVAGKILLEMLDCDLISSENEYDVFTYLAQAYAAGYDHGRLERKRRAVIQLSLEGEILAVHSNIFAAARQIDREERSIRKAIRGVTSHCGGYKWKYVDERDPNASEETVKSALSKLNRPVPGNHASKTKTA